MTSKPERKAGADLAIVVPHLGDGGVQRVAAILANEWSRRGKRVAVVTLYSEKPWYPVAPDVQLISILDHIDTPLLLRVIEGLRLRVGFLRRWARAAVMAVAQAVDGFLVGFAQWLGFEADAEPAWFVKLLERWGRALARLGGEFSPPRVFERFFETLPNRQPFRGLWRLYVPALVRVRTLQKVLVRLDPHAAIGLCGSTSVITALACDGLALRCIISERNDPSVQRLESPWEIMRERFYNNADIVTANTRRALESMKPYVDRDKLAFVPNPLNMPEDPGVAGRDKSVLIVARLHPQKAHDVLLRAFAKLSPAYDEWRLVIAGKGALEPELRALAAQLKIANRVDWLGQIDDPSVYYRRCGMFVLPSRHEGTPNALLEAMSYAMPAIVSDGSPGPLELIEDGRSGLVVPVDNADALSKAMMRVAGEPDLATGLGRAARTRVAEYDVPSALAVWDGLIGWGD